MMRGRQQQAAELLETAARLAPDRAEIMILLGIGAYLRGNHADSEHYFQRALAIDPSSKTASEYLTWLASTEH